MAKKLINRLTRTETQQNSNVEPDVLHDYSVGAFLTDEENRTLWVNGMPYGNAYISFNEDGIVNTRQPEHAEVFNDFNRNKAEGHYSHVEGGAKVNTVYNNAKITYLETPIDGYIYSVPHTNVLFKMIQVMARKDMNIPLYVEINREDRTYNTDDTSNDVITNYDTENTLLAITEDGISETAYEGSGDKLVNNVTSNEPIKYYIIAYKKVDKTIYFNVATSFDSATTAELPDYCNGKTMYFHYYYAYDGKDGWSEATKDGAHAEGISQARGIMSHSEGFANRSYEDYSHTEGVGNEVYGLAAHAEGDRNIVTNSAPYAHAEGHMNIAKADSVHVEGRNNLGNNTGAHVEGGSNIVNSEYGHAEGTDTINNGKSSHTEGIGTITNNDGEHAEGKYNYSFESDNFISTIGIGGGIYDRKNALAIKDDGRIYIASTEELNNNINTLYNPCSYNGTNTTTNSKSLQQILANVEEKMQNVTYAELLNYMQNGVLIPGKFYRISDYCTELKRDFINTGVRSAGHAFDIIVLALSKDTLSENTWAILKSSYQYNSTDIILTEESSDISGSGDQPTVSVNNKIIKDSYTDANPKVQAYKYKDAYTYEKSDTEVTLTSWDEISVTDDAKIVFKYENSENVSDSDTITLKDQYISKIILLHDSNGKLYIYNYYNYLRIFVPYYEAPNINAFNLKQFVSCSKTSNTYTIDFTNNETTYIFLDIVDIINNEPTLLTDKFIYNSRYYYNNKRYNLNAWKLKYKIDDTVFTNNDMLSENISLNTIGYDDSADIDAGHTLPTHMQNAVTYYVYTEYDKNNIIKNKNSDDWPINGFDVETDKTDFTKYNYRFNQMTIDGTNTGTYCILLTYKKPLSSTDKNYEAVLCENETVENIVTATNTESYTKNINDYNDIAVCNTLTTAVEYAGYNKLSVQHVYNGIHIPDDIDYFGNTISGHYRFAINKIYINDTLYKTESTPTTQSVDDDAPVTGVKSDYFKQNIASTTRPDTNGNKILSYSSNITPNDISNTDFTATYVAELTQTTVGTNVISNVNFYYCPSVDAKQLSTATSPSNVKILYNINTEYNTVKNEIVEISGDYNSSTGTSFKAYFYKYYEGGSAVVLNNESNIYETYSTESEIPGDKRVYQIFRTLYVKPISAGSEDGDVWKMVDNSFISDVLEMGNTDINTCTIIDKIKDNYFYTFGPKTILAEVTGSEIKKADNEKLHAILINNEVLIDDIYISKITDNGNTVNFSGDLYTIPEFSKTYDKSVFAPINNTPENKKITQNGVLFNNSKIKYGNKEYKLKCTTNVGNLNIGNAIVTKYNIYNFDDYILYYDGGFYTYYANSENKKGNAIICNILINKNINIENNFSKLILFSKKTNSYVGATELFGNENYYTGGFVKYYYAVGNGDTNNYHGQAEEYLYTYLEKITTLGYADVGGDTNYMAANIITYHLPYYFNKGYIYEFIDEYNNRFQYDATNIQFKTGDNQWCYTFNEYNNGNFYDCLNTGNIRNNIIYNEYTDKLTKNIFYGHKIFALNNKFENINNVILYNSENDLVLQNNTFSNLDNCITSSHVLSIKDSIISNCAHKTFTSTNYNSVIIKDLTETELDGKNPELQTLFAIGNLRVYNNTCNAVISNTSFYNKGVEITPSGEQPVKITTTNSAVTKCYNQGGKWSGDWHGCYNGNDISFTVSIPAGVYKLENNKYLDLGYVCGKVYFKYSSIEIDYNNSRRPDIYVKFYPTITVFNNTNTNTEQVYDGGHIGYNSEQYWDLAPGTNYIRDVVLHCALDFSISNKLEKTIYIYNGQKYVDLKNDVSAKINFKSGWYQCGATNEYITYGQSPYIYGIKYYATTPTGVSLSYNAGGLYTGGTISGIGDDTVGVAPGYGQITYNNYNIATASQYSGVVICTDGLLIKNTKDNYILSKAYEHETVTPQYKGWQMQTIYNGENGTNNIKNETVISSVTKEITHS